MGQIIDFDTEQTNTEIQLNPDEVKQRQDTYNSLTDLSRINLFTEEFQKQITLVEKKKSSNNLFLQANMFIMNPDNEKGMEQEILNGLFTKQNAITLLPDYQRKQKGWSLLESGMVFLSCCFVIMIYIL